MFQVPLILLAYAAALPLREAGGDNPRMPGRRHCELCDCVLPPHGFYLVRMDLFAEPSMPPVSSDDLDEMELGAVMDQLIEQMRDLSADELQDQVHRRFEYAVCGACHRKILANPLGKPRSSRSGEN